MSDNDVIAWITVIAIIGLAFVIYGVRAEWKRRRHHWRGRK